MKTYEELITNDSVLDFHEENVELMRKMPASIKNHHSYVGGYYDHVLEVMNFAEDLYSTFPVEPEFSHKDLMLAAYIHDLDKLLYRYEINKDKATDKQKNYAQSLGCELDEYETKVSISEKISAKKEQREFDKSKINPYKSREDGLFQEDSGIVMHLAYENGIKGITPNVVHAVGFHHGGFNPYATVNPNIELKPIAKMLHCADMLSTIQNGNK